MASPTNVIKRVPKWAWFVAAGVGVGGIALRKRQSDKAEQEAAVTGTDPETGQATGTAPPGVIVPPVIMGGGGEGSAQIDPAIPQIYTSLGETFTTGFANVLQTAQSLAWQPDQVIALVAGAGGSPNPAAQEPVVVNVTPPAPAPAPAPVSSPGSNVQGCPASHPHGTRPNCYNKCGHNDCRNHKEYRVSGHCYMNSGMKVLTATPTGKKC